MKKLLADLADKFLTKSAKKIAVTGCAIWCHREEIPNELL